MKIKLKLIVGLCFTLLLSCREEELPEGYYVFQPNAYYMIADGAKTLYLDVFKYDESYFFEKISDKAVFFHNGEALSNNTFTTTTIGEHKFKAQVGNWTSDEITVIARADKDYETISIPLIFHILYNDEPVGTGANISKEDVEEVVNIINQRFRNTYYSINYPNVIQNPNHVDTKIEFRLAKFDPQGNLLDEPGIKRYGGYDVSKWQSEEPQIQFMINNTWSPHDYVNICIASHNFGSSAFWPVSSSSHPFCAMEITYESWEDFKTRMTIYHGIRFSINSFYGGRDLTHELGHLFGLLHNFDHECGLERKNFGYDDCINDTQFYLANDFKYDFERNKIYKECGFDFFVNHDNYMDYYRSRDAVQFDVYYGFTYDQRDRMREILEFSPWIKDLKNSTK